MVTGGAPCNVLALKKYENNLKEKQANNIKGSVFDRLFSYLKDALDNINIKSKSYMIYIFYLLNLLYFS